MALGEIQELGGHGQGPETAEAIEVVNHSLQLQCSTKNITSLTYYISKCGNDEYHEDMTYNSDSGDDQWARLDSPTNTLSAA